MGRMHHHDKYAASKDGHRPDDPHGVTNQWKQDEIDKQQRTGNRAIRRTEQANAADMDALIQRHSEIQAVLNEPNIQREGHEVFDESANYGQRVSAFGKVERDASEEQGYPLEGDEAVDVVDGEEDQAFAKKAMYGQDFEGHVGANEYLGMGSPEGNAEGKRRQSEGAVKQARASESYPKSWQTGDPDRLSVPASKVLGHDNHQQLMIDASSTGGGETDSHMIPFVSTPDNIGMLKEGKWRAEGNRNQHTGKMHFSMHPDDPRSNRPPR